MSDPHPTSQRDTSLAPVYAATYDHLGIILWGPVKLAQVLDQELDWLERYPQFRIGWDHEAYTYDYLAEHDPKLLQRMREALEKYRGRLGVGSSTYGQPLSAFIDGESNIRQLTYAMETCEKRLGYSLSVYIMSEHPFHAQLPQLLVGAGFKGAVLRTHFMMYGHSPECEAPVVWWEGVDGSRLLALPTYPGEAATPPLKQDLIWGWTSTLDNRILTDAISERCSFNLSEFRRQFGDHIRPLIATRADDPRAQESLLLAHEGDPDYQWILVEDILRLLPQPRVTFRTTANDFCVRMPWGYCGNWMWNRCREAEVKVETTERLVAINHALGGPADENDLEQAWKNLLVAQHHDIQICGLEQDARQFLDASISASERITKRIMATIAPRIGVSGQGERIVVFNPLAWERTEWVPTDKDRGRLVTAPGLGFCAVSSDDRNSQGESVFSWQPEAQDKALLYQVEEKTDSGYRLVWRHEPVGRLETPYYDVFMAPTGGFRLLRDRQTGMHLLAPPKNSGTLAGIINGRDCESMGRISDVRIEPDSAVVIEEGEIGGISYRSEWRFYRHSRQIDWQGELDFNGQWIGRPKVPMPTDQSESESERQVREATVTAWNDHEYKLRLRFYPYQGPFTVRIRDIPFHSSETSERYVEGIYWTAISDGRVGLALFNRGLMGCVHEHDGAFSAVLAFALPYIWGTRMLRGKYRYELGILPFIGDWRRADLPRRALEYNFPLVMCRVSTLENPVGEVWTPYQELGDGKAILSALYVKNGKTYARFYECYGESAEVGFMWMGKLAKLISVDLREREQGELGGRARLGPWQVQTLAIKDG